MATTDTELKKLNQTVTEAVNILKLYVGNSAQIKSMQEKQRQAIEKWFEVTVEEEDQQKRQRAFTERARDAQGRFIKKQEMGADTFFNMAKSISGIFTGMAKSVGNAFTSMAEGIKTNLANFFQAIKSQFLSLFGEESEWFEILSSIKDSVTGFFKWVFSNIFRTPAWASKMIKGINTLVKLQIKQMKMDFLEASETKKGGLAGAALAGLGVAATILVGSLAGWIKARLMALNVLWQGFKILPLFKGLKLRILNFLKIFSKFFAMLEDIPLVGRILKMARFGLKWLAWPFTILIGIFDFIKGFKETEGSMIEKMISGFKAAFLGFIEMPVRMFAWLIEKTMALFGAKVDGLAEDLLGWIGTGFNVFVESIKTIFTTVKDIISTVSGILGNLIDWIKEKVPAWMVPDFLKDAETGIKGLEVLSTSPTKAIIEHDKKMSQDEMAYRDQMKTGQVDLLKEQKEANKHQATNQQSISNFVARQDRSGGGGDVTQIPDELDNNMLGFLNFNGEI